MARMISGATPVNASTYADTEKTLRQMADTGPGEVKATAQFVLDSIEGKHHSSAETEEQTNKFKDYCMNYTTD